jgi:hypothetical protein
MVPPLDILPILCPLAANRMAELSRRRSQLVREAFRLQFVGLFVVLPCSQFPFYYFVLLSYHGTRDNVRCLKNGECVSLSGTHLGHNLVRLGTPC